MTVGDFANARGEFASDPYAPRTRAGAPVRLAVNDAPLPKTLDVAILASQSRAFPRPPLWSIDLGGLLALAVPRPLPRSVPRFDAIHADTAAELAMVSSGMTIPFSRAIFSANDTCAGLGGLEPVSPSRSPPAFLGACRSRNARQMDPDFV